MMCRWHAYSATPLLGDDALAAIAARLCITRQAARLPQSIEMINCVENLVGGTYSAREAAEGLCMNRSTLSALIRSGVLRA